MASFSIVRTGILASLGMVALLGGCSSDDDTNTCGPAGAVKTFTVTLTKAAEVPNCAAAGANATGSATVTISADGCQVQVSNFAYSGLSGAVGMAHIHYGIPGVAGGIVLQFSSTASPINQTFTSSDYTAATGAQAGRGRDPSQRPSARAESRASARRGRRRAAGPRQASLRSLRPGRPRTLPPRRPS